MPACLLMGCLYVVLPPPPQFAKLTLLAHFYFCFCSPPCALLNLAILKCTIHRGGGVEKNSFYRRTIFWGGTPGVGGGGYEKKMREEFFRTPKPEIFLTLRHVFGFGRCKEGIFQRNHGYLSRYGWYLRLRTQRPPVCSACSAAPHPGLLCAGKSTQIRQYTLSGARNRTSSIEGQR